MSNPRLTRVILLFLLLPACAFAPARVGGARPTQGGAGPARHAAPESRAEAKARRRLFVGVRDSRLNHVAGLTQFDFSVYDGGRPVEVLSFSGEDEPASVAVLMDVSGSVLFRDRKEIRRGDKARVLRGVLARLLAAGHPSNEYFLFGFNQGIQPLLDRGAGRGGALAAADKFFEAAPFKGKTALFDACYVALNVLGSSARHRKRALVVISDGQDNASRYKSGDVQRALKEGDTIVYAVMIPGPYEWDTFMNNEGRATLEAMTSVSGGAAYFPADYGGIEDAASHVGQGLRSLYSIEIGLEAGGRKDEWHELRVRVSGPADGKGEAVKLHALARKGFYAPAAAGKAVR